jgi:hypothetical protein
MMEKKNMSKENPKNFPIQSRFELVQVYINTELKKAGINLRQISVDGTVFTVSTDKEVSKEGMSNICQYAACKDITVIFS